MKNPTMMVIDSELSVFLCTAYESASINSGMRNLLNKNSSTMKDVTIGDLTEKEQNLFQKVIIKN